MSIAAYDYLLTLPLEVRLYKSSDRIGLGLILFILIRYSSIVVIVVSNVGFFYPRFSSTSCGHYYHAIPVFKVIQLMVSQTILGVRTYCISLSNVWVGRIISLAYFIVVTFQWFSALAHRIPVMTGVNASGQGNCIVGNSHPKMPISTWSMHLAATLYGCLVLSIATYYLLRMRITGMSAASRLENILLYDGLIYIVASTAVDVVNIFLFRGTPGSIQPAGASLGSAATWIMSQRILTHPRQAREGQSSLVVMTLRTPHVIPPARRSSGETKPEVDHGISQASPPDSQYGFVSTQGDCEQQVRVERAVVVDNDPEVGGSLTYTSPNSVRDREHTV
ncbi:hypothetical protein BJV78DRAFT_556294 [Lactifluus subvellereus]|nr:hypothetical protein BJV78DRAFT_556294 [Lactifluus subvellereus]